MLSVVSVQIKTLNAVFGRLKLEFDALYNLKAAKRMSTVTLFEDIIRKILRLKKVFLPPTGGNCLANQMGP